MSKEFKRVNEHHAIMGVCGGLAYALGIKVWIVRLLTFLGVLFTGSIVFWVYIAIGLFAPEWTNDPADYVALCE